MVVFKLVVTINVQSEKVHRNTKLRLTLLQYYKTTACLELYTVTLATVNY